MAFVNAASSFAYGFVESTWQVSSVVFKYFVLGHLLYLAANRSFSLETLEDNILKTTKPLILGAAVAGLFLYLAGIQVTPLLPLFSQSIAVVTLGFVFWRY